MQSYRLSIEDNSKRYRQIRQDEGNYFRVIQGFHTQALRLQMGLNRQNSMFYDVLNALQRRKEGKKSLANDVMQLKEKTDVDAGTATGKLVNVDGETAVLRVDLKKSGVQVLLYKGQWIRTPMGDANILSIQPKDEKVVLQLPFGKMYANLRRVVCWGRANSAVSLLDLGSDEVLRQRWTALQSSFSISAEVSRGISELVGQSDDEAVTDKDDDNSNDDTSPIDNITEDIINGGGVQCGQTPVENGQGNQIHSSSSVIYPSPPSTSVLDSTSTICSFPLKGFARSSVPAATTGVLASTLSRSALRTVCANPSSESNVSQQMELSRILPIIFAPPGGYHHIDIISIKFSMSFL